MMNPTVSIPDRNIGIAGKRLLDGGIVESSENTLRVVEVTLVVDGYSGCGFPDPLVCLTVGFLIVRRTYQ